MIRHILFDLDGTLLPMSADEFAGFYLPMLCARVTGLGMEPKTFLKEVWKGVGAMVANCGAVTNEEAFWTCFEQDLGIRREDTEPIFLDFYTTEFNKAIASTQPTKLSDEIVKTLKAKGYKLYLATNPIFPRVATMNRIQWAGMDAKDFEEITTYEMSHSCKPNVEYFREILERNKLKPEECMMVGNDVEEDLSISNLGVTTYIITDCLENKKGLPNTADRSSSLQEFYEFVKKLPAINE